MEFLKKSWKWIAGAIGFIVGLIWFMNANSNRKVKRIKKDIKSNQKKTKEIDKKVENIKKEKAVTKKKIEKTNQQLKNVRNKKPVVKKKSGNKASQSVRNRLKNK